MVECQRELREVELDVLLREHYLHAMRYAALRIQLELSGAAANYTTDRVQVSTSEPVNARTSFESRVKRSPPRRNSRMRYSLPSVWKAAHISNGAEVNKHTLCNLCNLLVALVRRDGAICNYFESIHNLCNFSLFTMLRYTVHSVLK